MPEISVQQKEDLRAYAASLGAFRTGFARAEHVSDEAGALYRRWIGLGRHGSMAYCARYAEVRDDPRLLLDGALSVVVCAFCYRQPRLQTGLAQHISSYAYGPDYHRVVRRQMAALGDYITANYGGEVRALVDTAPMRERYWAVKAGLGFTGINNQLIIPGAGSYFFLGELLWSGSLPPDQPCHLTCQGCMACVKACPGHALDGKGGCDARRCVSYLTIEHRGDLPPDTDLGHWIYGCDTCQRVCPHNAVTPPNILFPPSSQITDLDDADLRAMSSSHFRRITADSAMQRVSLAQLLRNIDHTSPDKRQ